MNLRRCLILLVCCCAFAAPAFGAAADEDANRAKLLQLQQSLKARLAAAPDDIELTYQLGVVAYKLRDYLTALEMFERVLALNPNHAGALLDMALTHYERGDYDEARQLFDRLAAMPDLPPRAAGVITGYRARLAASRTPWQAHGSLALALGHSSNANQGLSGDAVDLPLLGTFTPAPSSMAQADGFTELSFDGRAERPWGDRTLYLVGGWRERLWRNQHDFNQRWLIGGAGLVSPLAPQLSWDSSILAIEGWLGDRPLEHAGYWLNQLTLERNAWSHWLRLETDTQRFPSNPTYNARQLKLVLGSAYTRPGWKLLGEVGALRDASTRLRPGGDRHGVDWLLEGKLKLAPRWSLGGQWRGDSEHQQSPFDPADFGPFMRVDHSHSAAVTLTWQSDSQTQWELGYLRSRISSNLGLYDLSRDEVRLEWRRNWD